MLSIENIRDHLTPEERAYPVALLTGWEGDDYMTVGMIVIAESASDADFPHVILSQHADGDFLRGVTVRRIFVDIRDVGAWQCECILKTFGDLVTQISL